MAENTCNSVNGCPVGVPHTHMERHPNVMLTIHPDMVGPGMWDCDATSHYAVAFDTDSGRIVWRRFSDWYLYGMHNGWERVALISE